jgi:hypothetical protein
MPCSCGGMRRAGLAPNNIAIKQKQQTNVQQFYTPPTQQRPIPPPQQPQTQTQTSTPTPQLPFQSNRPNFSGNLPSIRRK